MSKPRKEIGVSIVAIVVAAIIVSSSSVLPFVVLPARGQSSPGFTLKWAKYIGLGTYVGALAAHLVPGSKDMQIVVTGVSAIDRGYTNGSVIVLNGTDGSLIWKLDANGIEDHSPFEIADLNNDGNKEIVVADLGRTLAFYANGSVYWNSSAPSYVNWPVIGDVNGDGYPELFVCSGQGPYEGIDYITELSHDGRILAQTPSWHPCWGGLSLADPAFNGTFILYQGDRSSTYNPSGDAYKGGGWGVRALDARTLTPLWNDSQILSSSHIPMLVDVDGDGVLDVVVGWQSNGLAVYNAFNGGVLTTGGIYRKNSTLGLTVHSQPTIYVDTNGRPQLITNLNSNPIVWDLKSWQKTATLPYSTGEPPKMGRVTGDNQSDIILVESGNVHVFNQSFQEIANFTGLTNPNEFTLVQDIDGDGYNELVLTSRSGWVYALSTSAKAPTPLPRSDVSFYSEYRLGVADYVEPPGPKTPLIGSPDPANGAIGVPINQSTLSFNLTDYQDYPMNYTVTTNPNIGEGNGTNVGNGKYNISIGVLNYSTTYSWTMLATDGRIPKVTTYTFTTISSSNMPPPQQDWWDASWQYRLNVTIDHTKVTANLINFPVLIDLTSSSLATHAQTSGNDIVFIDSSGHKLNHEIESYSSASGRLVAWVLIPNLSSTTNTVLSLYYGNPSSPNQQKPNAVWDPNFLLVQHLNAPSSTQYDSTSNHNDGTTTGAVTPGTPGKIAGSISFTGGYMTLPTVLSSQTRFTFSAWIYAQSGARYFISKWANNQGAFLQVVGNNYIQFYVNNIMVQKLVTLNQWHYVVGTFNGSVMNLWVDGGSASSVSASSLTWPSQNTYVGDRYDHTRQFIGLIDEVRVSSIARSNDWINTEYIDQNSPSAFYTVGSQESFSP